MPLSRVDLDFVCNGDEYMEKGGLPAMVSMCRRSSVPCSVHVLYSDLSDATVGRCRKAFSSLCPGHSLSMSMIPDEYMELVGATAVRQYGVDCVKLFLQDIVDHDGDVFVYNDCDTVTVGDVGAYASRCVEAGLGTKYPIGLARNMVYKGKVQIFKYFGGFHIGSQRMLRDGGYGRDVACRMLMQAPLLPSMHYNSDPACVDGRILELSPYWLFTRFFTSADYKMDDSDLNEMYNAVHPLGFSDYDSSRYWDFAECYHFSGPDKPWRGGGSQPGRGVEEWREVYGRCREAMDA